MANDGGPAFPSSNDVKLGEIGTHGHAGMTLRDFFAGQALVGLLMNHTDYPEEDSPQATRMDANLVATAYVLATAMIAEREKF